jgi:integrase
VRFLGEARRVDQVATADADGYRAHMVASGLARATIAKRCRYARHYFDIAKRRGLAEDNPFAHITGAVAGNPARRVFVPAEIVAKVIDVAPDPQWKLLIALARFGGLRTPSESLALTWQDVDFANKRFVVRASKTAHHADGGVRIVPMFPELVEHFQRVFDQAEEGATHVITRYRNPAANLRTQFQRYITAAGVKPWPKLWQNLRASRATELADEFPSHVCAAWLGHTEKIADANYRMVTDEHFARATTAEAHHEAHRKAHKHTPAMPRNDAQAETQNAVCSPLREVAQHCEAGNGPYWTRTSDLLRVEALWSPRQMTKTAVFPSVFRVSRPPVHCKR